MEQVYNPGACDVLKALITPYGGEAADGQDITGLIHRIIINQSISRPAMFGTIEVVDNIGLLERLPLRGEETLDLKLKSYDIQTEREIKLHIYKIDDVQPTQIANGTAYTLHFLTKLSYEANLNYFIKAYRDVLGHDAAVDVFKKHYSSLGNVPTTSSEKEFIPEGSVKHKIESDPTRSFYVEPSYNNMRVIIPRLAPSEAISFITARCFSNKSSSSSFRFFETWDGYYFATDEWFHQKSAGSKEIKTFDYLPFQNKDPERAIDATSAIEKFSNPRRVDVATEMIDGAYQNTVIEIDLLRHKVNRNDYSYLQSDAEWIEQNPDNINLSKKAGIKTNFKTSSGRPADVSIDVHSEDFIKETFTPDNSKRFMIVRDYTQKVTGSGKSRDNTFYGELSAFRNMYTKHLGSTGVTIGLRGRLDLTPGEVINIDVRELDSGGEALSNRKLSGRYFVRSVLNTIDKGILSTVCTISKYGYSDARDDKGDKS